MMAHRHFFRIHRYISRKYSSKRKVELSEEICDEIANNAYKPRKHPGRMEIKNVELPQQIIAAIEVIIGDYPVKSLLNDSIPMVHHLHHRVAPMESEQIEELKGNLLDRIMSKHKNIEINSGQEASKFKKIVHDKLYNQMKEKVYNWKPMNYNEYNSLVYLIARSAQEYAVLVQIFSEINKRDENFKPKSFFDFGSGVGTATWAANQFWKKSIYEYFNVDTSAEMNDLALILLQGGRGNKSSSIKGTFFRQFFPHQNVTYDLVVCAYSLLELPSFQTRMETVLRLWNKTEKYLVLVEYGTNAGFRVINEARDFILQIEDETNKGHIFSPCPHDMQCPRFLANDQTPCNFQVGYFPLPLGNRKPEVLRELYSYVVLKKGKRQVDDPQWPRLVREVLVRSKHSVCRMCTSNGKIEEVIFTAAKHGKITYHCARSSKWGDRLPIRMDKPPKE